MFKAIQKQSVSDEVFDQLRNRIVYQELKAGEELPSDVYGAVICQFHDVFRVRMLSVV